MGRPLAILYFMICALGLCAEDRKVPGAIAKLCDQGMDHFTAGILDSAVVYFLRAELQALQLPKPAEQALSLETIGQYYRELDFRSQSLEAYERALSTWEALGDKTKMTGLLDTIATIHYDFQDFTRATSYWHQAKSMLEARQDREALDSLREKIERSLQRQQLAVSADSIARVTHARKLKHQEIDHLFEKVLLQIDLEEEKSNLQYAFELDKEKALFRHTLFLLILVALLLILLFFFFQMKRKANQDLSALNEEISTQKAILEQQNGKLEELDRMKSHFFTNISHEFRTPLTVIAGAVHEIRHSGTAPEQALEVIDRNNNNLLLLVNQILDLRKLEAGKMELDLVQDDVIAYLGYLLESFETLAAAQNKNLYFISHATSVVMDYDPEKLLRVVSNLLSNALKYTSEGKDIYVLVHREFRETEQLILSVKDAGIGIPADKLPYIFDRFYQLDDWIYRREESTGIGLALTRELVALMGGTIEVQSDLGQGTNFTVQLPVTNQAPLQVENQPRPEPLSPLLQTPPEEEEAVSITTAEDLPHLLLIEDNPDVVRYTTTLLQGAYRITVARNGEEGLTKALETIPDLVVSDLKMPIKNGYEVCQTLKTDHRTSHIPFVLVSAQAEQEARNEGFRSGADAYLIKPFNREELFIRLEQLIELRRRLRERYAGLAPIVPSTDPVFQKEDTFIATLQAVIEEHLDDENFGIPEICKAIGMSRSQLHLKIKALTGRSTSHYIRGFRLVRAREMFDTSDLNVTEVAFEVGFRDVSYFSRSFSSEFGLSPRDYLKAARPD